MIAEVAFGLAVKKNFDYDATNCPSLKRGMRVWVDFNNKKRMGIVVNTKKKHKPTLVLKPIIDVLDDQPAFPANLLKLSEEMTSKYLYSQGDILETMLPSFLRRNRKLMVDVKEAAPLKLPVNKDRLIYVRENINRNKRLFYYKEIILQTLKEKRKVIVCLPQKEAVYKLRDFLEEHCKDIKIALLFGSLKSSSQFKEWLRIRQQTADVSIGTRFAIFSPFTNLGLIIVEKENFYGYFQPQKPFYHLRDLALIRAKKEKALLVLHSDMPSLQVYGLLKQRKARMLDLSVENRPRVKIFNLKDYKFKRYPVLSDLSQELVRKYLEANERVIIFWNRKGFSHILRCSFCGEVLKCSKCGGYLSFSLDSKTYLCSRCGYQTKAKSKCPKCRQGYIRNLGLGIERLEAAYRRIFPAKRIVTLSKQTPFKRRDWDILITTGKLVFLEEIPSADLVVVSGLDFTYSLGDFSSSVELFFLLERLKDLARAELIIFTLSPEYYPLQAIFKDWGWFYEKELKERRALGFPPYLHVAKVTLRQKNQDVLLSSITSFRNSLENTVSKKDAISIYGPLRDTPFRSGGKFHYFLFIKAKKLGILKKVLDKTITKFKKSSAKISLIIQ